MEKPNPAVAPAVSMALLKLKIDEVFAEARFEFAVLGNQSKSKIAIAEAYLDGIRRGIRLIESELDELNQQ
jgi:hypothetical protein